MRATAKDENLQGKINDEVKEKILDKCDGIISCLDKNQTAERERAEHWQKELEKKSQQPHHYSSLPSSTRGLVVCWEECLGASLVMSLFLVELL